MDLTSRVLPKIHIKQKLRGFYSKTMVSYYSLFSWNLLFSLFASVNITIVSQYHIKYTELKVHNCIILLVWSWNNV